METKETPSFLTHVLEFNSSIDETTIVGHINHVPVATLLAITWDFGETVEWTEPFSGTLLFKTIDVPAIESILTGSHVGACLLPPFDVTIVFTIDGKRASMEVCGIEIDVHIEDISPNKAFTYKARSKSSVKHIEESK